MHGFLGRGADWDGVALELGPAWDIRAPDLPGHGKRTADTPPASLEELADRLWTDIDPPAPAVLAGYSFGGRVALAMALRQPRRTRALILMSATPGIEDPAERRRRATVDANRARRMLSGPFDRWLKAWYSQPVFRSLQRKPSLLAAVEARRAVNEPATLAPMLRNLSPGREPSRWKDLRTLRMPVLFLAGIEDSGYVSVGLRVTRRLPQGRFAVIPDAGHTVHLEQPAIVAAAIRGFLREFPLTGGELRRTRRV